MNIDFYLLTGYECHDAIDFSFLEILKKVFTDFGNSNLEISDQAISRA